jgi:serine/threonine-protein kinase
MNPAPSTPPPGTPYAVVGRYAIFDEIASGGMATVHLGRLLGAAGFSRTVAIKKLHPQFARDAEFAAMFMDEAHLASRISHPNVVQTIDVVPSGKDILLVMEYVHGVPFAQLLGTSRRTGWRVPPRIIAGVMVGALEGLHAAHEARSETGAPLGVVHRDVSPQNVLVGIEGVPRVIDFGVAKAMGKMHATREGQLKGKLAYMSPEQVRGVDVTRLSDVFSAAIVLWEALMAERLFDGKNPAELIMQVLSEPIRPPRSKFPDLPEELEAVVMKGLSRDPAGRFATAREMAVALEAAAGVAPAREIAEWVEAMAGPALAQRAKLLEAIERSVAAPPTAGERTRIESLRASLPESGLDLHGDTPGSGSIPKPASDRGDGSGSGQRARPIPIAGALPSDEKPSNRPIPIAGALSSDQRPADPALDDTMAQKLRSVRPVPPETSRLFAPPGHDGGLTPGKPGSAPHTPGTDDPIPLPSPSDPMPAPVPDTLAEMLRAGNAGVNPPQRAGDPAAQPAPYRPHRIPIPVQEPDESMARSAFVARLAWPLRLVGAGVVISLVDFGLRQLDVPLPIRPIWIAEMLVVVGVIWAFVTVFVSSRDA